MGNIYYKKTHKSIKLTAKLITQRRKRNDSNGTTTEIHQITTINKRKRKEAEHNGSIIANEVYPRCNYC